MAEQTGPALGAESDGAAPSEDGPAPSTPEVLEADPDGADLRDIVREVVFEVRREVTYHGPIPDPDTLARMCEIYPDAAETIFKGFSAQNSYRIKIEAAVINNDITLSRRGQAMGFALGVLTVTLGFIAIISGHDWAGVALSTSGVSGLVGIFVYGRKSDAAERVSKKAVQEKVRRGDPVEELSPPDEAS